MPLELLRIYNARNLKEFSLSPNPFFNIIYGSNGVGKTTILESVYLLLRSRTFRSSKYKTFINSESNECTVYSMFSDNTDPLNNFTLGISRSLENTFPTIHLNQKKVNSISTISNLVVMGLITPDSFNLLDAGPSVRRKFIDWGVFHVEHSFITHWRSYKKILNNRNLLLKKIKKNPSILKHELDNLNCWTPQLVNFNNILNSFRSNQIQNITPYFNKYLEYFSKDLSSHISLEYYRGWSFDLSYEEYLSQKINDDISSSTTRFGTHRSEIRIKYKKSLAKDILSRGQKKIIIICLILSQFSFLKDLETNSQTQNLLLLDDLDSELDSNNLKILFKILSEINTQCLITTTDYDKYKFLDCHKVNMFHVEQMKN